MIPNQGIDNLAELMSERYDDRSPTQFITQSSDSPDSDGVEPYILILGSGCSRSAGVPTFEEIALKVFESLSEDEEWQSYVPPQEMQSDSKKLLKAFYKLLDKMTNSQVFRMLQSFYVNIPVPMFYQDLAVLARAGYFNRILTTNFDTLLEQALDGAGLQPDIDYQVTSLGVKSKHKLTRESWPDSSYPTKDPLQIIKLHGDIAQQQMNIAPWNIEDALVSQRRMVKSELQGDIVMVGYNFECEPINDWLKSGRRDQLWWVGPEPEDAPIDIQNWAERIFRINHEIGKPETFFNQLSLRLLRLPMLESLNKNLSDYAQQEESFSGGYKGIVSRGLSSSDDDLFIEDLRGNIRRNQAMLYSLEQSAPPGERPQNIQAQIDYQKRQIAELEDKLRSQPKCKDRLSDLIEEISAAVQKRLESDDLQQSTLSFLNMQRDTLNEEYHKPEVNQHVISAAIGAVIVLMERLNVESDVAVVNPELVRELSSFVPSMTARG